MIQPTLASPADKASSDAQALTPPTGKGEASKAPPAPPAQTEPGEVPAVPPPSYEAPPTNYGPPANYQYAPPSGYGPTPGYGRGWNSSPPVDPGPLRKEDAKISARLTVLKAKRDQHSIGGPIAMLAAGFGGMVAMLFASAAAAAEADLRRSFGEDDTRARNAAITTGALGAFAFGVGVTGVIVFTQRVRARRVYTPEIRKLRLKQRDIQRQLRYRVKYTGPHGPQATLELQF